MAITDWPKDERPRERLLAQGAGALSDAELLAIFLRVGVTGCSAVDLARQLLNKFGSLAALFAAPEKELSTVHGMGQAKYTQLQAVLEMSRRALGETLKERDLFDEPDVVRHWLKLHLGSLAYEVFFVLFLDSQNRLICAEEVFRGTLNKASVYPREIVKLALAYNAASVVLAHNHPSGQAEPSDSDHMITQMLVQALSLIDIEVLDHFIVAGSAPPLSFAERGLI